MSNLMVKVFINSKMEEFMMDSLEITSIMEKES